MITVQTCIDRIDDYVFNSVLTNEILCDYIISTDANIKENTTQETT
jgi:hypothetical protein